MGSRGDSSPPESGAPLLSNFNALIPTLSALDGFAAEAAAFQVVGHGEAAMLMPRPPSAPREFFEEDAVLVYNEPFAKLVSSPDDASRRAAAAQASPRRGLRPGQPRGPSPPAALQAENIFQRLARGGKSGAVPAAAAPAEDVIMEVRPRRHPLPTSVLAAAVEASELYGSSGAAGGEGAGAGAKKGAGGQQQRGRRGAGADAAVFESEGGRVTCTVGPPSMPGSVIVTGPEISNAAVIDAKRARRILANRQSAQRSKERKQQYVSSLEREVEEIKSRAADLEARLDESRAEGREALRRLGESEKRLRLAETVSDTLRREVEHLRQANKAICAAVANQEPAGDAHPGGLRRSTSGSMLQKLERALSQRFDDGAPAPAADAAPPAANWLADFRIEAASPDAQAFAAGGGKGIKRKNTAP